MLRKPIQSFSTNLFSIGLLLLGENAHRIRCDDYIGGPVDEVEWTMRRDHLYVGELELRESARHVVQGHWRFLWWVYQGTDQ